MTDNQKRAVMALRLIAAVAEKAADDLENGRLWPGQLGDQLNLISMNMRDASAGERT